MPRSNDATIEVEDAIRGPVRERARNRLFVMLEIFAAFTGLIIATSLMYIKP